MAKVMAALLALALFVPAIALAQDNGQQNDNSRLQQQEANQSAQDSMEGGNTSPHHMMTGMVSDDGRTFTSNNTTWHVSNPGALKNYNNQNVKVKFQFNSEKNTIKINKVESAQ